MPAQTRARNARERACEFLRIAHHYQLGSLTTEQPHPATRDLSEWARHDLPRAVAVLKDVDVRALEKLEQHAPHIDRLGRRVRETMARGRRVYLCGCGATGRLCLSLESFWRQRGGGQVRSFMAGGDVALVHALEGFEDHPAYGARHLEAMGFVDGDLLIACTEGGETPYVIGATERAAEISANAPCFLYCNPDEVLVRHVARFRRLRDNPGIERIGLDVGPMALAGSTRMQASTVLQLAVGLALLDPHEPAREAIADFTRRLRDTDVTILAGFAEKEAEIYAAGDHVTYEVADYGITVLTDTTERAPTFSLVPFDQLERPLRTHSLCYVALQDAGDAGEAWRRLLGRPPRVLDWPEVDARTAPGYLHRFDFSASAAERRRQQIPHRRHHGFRIHGSNGDIVMRLDDVAHAFRTAGLPVLLRHLLLKQILNLHSTMVMGRLGRYEGNLMTWVSPANCKLIDRAARYVGHLLARAGRTDFPYEEVVHQLFVEMDRVQPGEPVVPRTCRALLQRRAAS